jgi:hypothetical protein
VTFGGTAAIDFFIHSDTLVEATSPIASGTVDIVVGTPGGTSGTSTADLYTYPAGQPPAVAALPVVMNGAYGGYLTTAYLQNIGNATASIFIRYFDTSGNPVGSGDAVGALPVNANWTVRQDNGHSFAAGQAGTAIIYSSQPIAAFVNEFAPGGGDGSSYTAVPLASGTGTTMYAPAVYNNAFGGYFTGINLVNLGSGATDVTITYRNQGGTVVQTQSLPGVPAHAYQASYSGAPRLLPAGFTGTATITSSSQPIAVTVNEVGFGGFSSYDAVPSGSTTLEAPAALNNAYGGYTTGMNLQNTTGNAGTVTVTYYDTLGNATIKSASIAANGYLAIYQGGPLGPPASNTGYTAVLSSTVPIVAIVNEVYNPNTALLTSYNTFSAGSGTAHMALVEFKGSDGWSTGLNIMNTGGSTTTVTTTYYDADTGALISQVQNQVAPNASLPIYQGVPPPAGLPAGTRATAVVATSAGGQVAVICNEVGPGTFMSYGGQ